MDLVDVQILVIYGMLDTSTIVSILRYILCHSFAWKQMLGFYAMKSCDKGFVIFISYLRSSSRKSIYVEYYEHLEVV